MTIPGLPDPLGAAQGLTFAGAAGVGLAAGTLALNALVVRPKRRLGAFVAHAVIREQHSDQLQITDHPVAQGAKISDHAIKLPATVTLEMIWSNTPAVGLGSGVLSADAYSSAFVGTGPGQAADIYAKLLDLQTQRVPFDIVTGKRKYANMLLQSLGVVTDKESENILRVTATCREVLIVSLQTTTVPSDPARHADPSSTAPTTNAGDKSLAPAPHYHTGP